MTDLAPPGTTAVSTRGLRKTYRHRGRRVVAVGGLDLDVPLGGVHGFLGPDGAGKTTTIRMLLGLVRPDAGTVRVLDRPVPDALPDVVQRVGAIVESPRFFPAFSGRRNLELLAAAIGTPPARVDRVLADVGLADRAGSPFRTYSLGMKQRLAIAATLLKDPELVIFDEPTNGLDPAGIHEVRRTMRALADAGRTVLVSSHILAEVQQVADTVSIVTQGRLVASGHIERSPHPRDRRSVLLVPTEKARSEMARHLAYMHGRMREIAAAVPVDARPAVIEFLTALTREMESDSLDVTRP